jgi:hypothetical protein
VSPFEYLGLRPEADERDVRKAYARLLKTNRPDDDPVAFQQVNQAYQAALEFLRRQRWEQAQAEAEAETEETVPQSRESVASRPQRAAPAPAAPQASEPVATPAPETSPPSAQPGEPALELHAQAQPEPEPEPLYFDFPRFMDELFLRLETKRADEVSAWLYALPELYSIRLKTAITMDVLRLVAERQPPVSARALQSVSDFFGVDNLGPSGWWLSERIDRARHRAEMLDRFRRVPMPRTVRGQDDKLFDLKIDEEIVRPRSAWRTALLLATPGAPTRVRDRMHEVDRLSEGVAEELMDPGRRALYFELADRSRISRKRLGLSLARTALLGGSLTLLAAWLELDAAYMATLTGAVALFWVAWQLVVAGVMKLHARLSAAGHDSLTREGFALLFLAVGITLSGHPSLNEQWSGIGFFSMLAAGRLAVTHARLRAGIPLAIVLWLADITLATRFADSWPFQPGLLGLSLLTLLVLAADRIRAKWTKVPVTVLARETRPLALLLAGTVVVCLAGVNAALILAGK